MLYSKRGVDNATMYSLDGGCFIVFFSKFETTQTQDCPFEEIGQAFVVHSFVCSAYLIVTNFIISKIIYEVSIGFTILSISKDTIYEPNLTFHLVFRIGVMQISRLHFTTSK